MSKLRPPHNLKSNLILSQRVHYTPVKTNESKEMTVVQ